MEKLILETQGRELANSFLWAQALTSAFNSGEIATNTRVNLFSAGFVKVPSYLHWKLDNSPIEEGYVFGGQTVAAGVSEGSVDFFTIEGVKFPIITVGDSLELHGAPPSPTQHGSSWQATCWVKNNTPGGWSEGILTCRHGFTSLKKGVNITLTPSKSHSTPTLATLEDFDNCTIDGAVLSIKSHDWPPAASSLSCQPATAPGQAIKFETTSGTVLGYVLRTYQMPNYVGNLFGQRIITDQHGGHGDSGTLLCDSKTSEGVGVYMGSIKDGSGGKEGIFQALSQVTNYFNLSLYS